MIETTLCPAVQTSFSNFTIKFKWNIESPANELINMKNSEKIFVILHTALCDN